MIDTCNHPMYNDLFNAVMNQTTYGLDVSFERSYLNNHKTMTSVDQCVWTGREFLIRHER